MILLLTSLGCVDGPALDASHGPPSAQPARTRLSAPPTISGTEDQKFIPADAVQYASAGLAVAALGDIDSDGYDDAAVFAQSWDGVSYRSQGAVYLLYGSASGLGSEQRIDPSDPSEEGYFGRGLSRASDINGDGHLDLVVGAPGSALYYPDSVAAIYSFMGSASGLDLSTEAKITPSGAVDGTYFGNALAALGDTNGDGFDDIAVSAWNGLAADGLGSVVLYHGSSAGLDIGTQKEINSSDLATNTSFGYALGDAGDLDQDGYEDLITSAIRADGAATATGALYAYLGSSAGIAANSEVVVWANDGAYGDQLGYSVAGVGDIDGDGHPDVVVGAHRAEVNSLSYAGAAYVFYGDASGLDLSRQDKLTSGTPAQGEYFGESVARGGDLDGDGFPDLLIGSATADLAASSGGGAWIIFGDGAGLDPSSVLALAPSDNQRSDYFGSAIAGDMDVDGDGLADLLAGAYSNDDAAAGAGAAYVYLGACRDLDGDGVCAGEDCDDDDSAVGVATDVFHLDQDGDGYGALSADSVTACALPSGYVDNYSDCDDTNADIRPGGDELCGGVDEDCDGQRDEDDAADAPTWYGDGDGDGYGTSGATLRACAQPSGYVDNADDCDDGRAAVNPGAEERCDDQAVDEDCDGLINDADEDVTGGATWYADGDGDGYGGAAVLGEACEPLQGSAPDDSDCDDGDPSVYPGAPELAGDGVDQDCDGVDAEGADDSSAGDDTGVGGGDKDGGCSSAPGAPKGLLVLLALGLALRRRPLAAAPPLR